MEQALTVHCYYYLHSLNQSSHVHVYLLCHCTSISYTYFWQEAWKLNSKRKRDQKSIWFPNPFYSLLSIFKTLFNKFIDVSSGFCLKFCLCHSQDITDTPPSVTIFRDEHCPGHPMVFHHPSVPHLQERFIPVCANPGDRCLLSLHSVCIRAAMVLICPLILRVLLCFNQRLKKTF